MAFTEYIIAKALMVRRMILAVNDEFETYDGISKINSILKTK